MENTQNLSFERNRYYSGKMLTSVDFQAEQDYFNSKRRFMNRVTFGDGIACGLNVVRLDDRSILIESGTAIDPSGREIVVEKDIVRKLSAIEGFESHTSENLSLVIEYDETPVHAVYAINSQSGDHTQYNRIAENYKLSVIDEDDNEKDLKSDFFTEDVLLETEDYRMIFRIPSIVCRGMNAKASVVINKLSDSGKLLNYTAVLQIPSFETEDGKQELVIDFEDVAVAKGESITRDYWLYAKEGELKETTLVFKAGTVRASVGSMYIKTPELADIKIKITGEDPQDLVTGQIGRINLETRMQQKENTNYVILCNIQLERSALNYIIDDIDTDTCRKYINMPCDSHLFRKYLDNFSRRSSVPVSAAETPDIVNDLPSAFANNSDIRVSSGILEIPLTDTTARGDICYSSEIVHGLGKGNVYVEVGYESIRNDDSEISGGVSTKSTIYGNPTFFATEDEQLGNIDTAVKVLNDKGSFVVAAKINREVNFLVLTFHWVAIKFPSEGDSVESLADERDKSIQAETPTVLLGTKSSHYFGVRFKNMERCSLTYSLSEVGTGEITADGVYTSPNKEGVFEIKISCTDNPGICTYAYAIVKRKLDGEEEEVTAPEGGEKAEESLLKNTPLSDVIK